MPAAPLVLDAPTMEALLNTEKLLAALRHGFMQGTTAPARMHYALDNPEADRFLLLIPAWNSEYLGTKVVTVFPNRVPSIAAQYLLFDAQRGSLEAILDGTALTPWRTAAVSALASSTLSRANSKSLLLLGTGAVARCMLRAHCWVRSFERIFVWGRNHTRLQAFVDDARSAGFSCDPVTDYRSVISDMDIVSSSTAAVNPLIMGAEISPGTHVDLVGSFRPTSREADDQLMQIASKYADTITGTVKESGDFAIPIAQGTLSEQDILGDLLGMAEARSIARQSDDEVTVFKSVGTAVADLSAGIFALKAFAASRRGSMDLESCPFE